MMGAASSSAREDIGPIDIKMFQDRGAIKKDIDAIGVVEKHLLFWEEMGHMFLDSDMTIQQLRSFPDTVKVRGKRHGVPVGKGKVVQIGTGSKKSLITHKSFCTLCYKGYPIRVHWKITSISHFWCEVCASRFSWVNLGHFWSIAGIGEIHIAQENIRKNKLYGTNTAIHGVIEHLRIRKWETMDDKIDDVQGTNLSKVSAQVLGGLTETKERRSDLDLTNLSIVSHWSNRVDTLRAHGGDERAEIRGRHLWTQRILPRVRVTSGNRDLNRIRALKAHTRAALVIAMTRLNTEQLKMLAEDTGVMLAPQRYESLMRSAQKISPAPDVQEPMAGAVKSVAPKRGRGEGISKPMAPDVKEPVPKAAKTGAPKTAKPAKKIICRGSVGHVLNGTKNKFGGNPPNPQKCARNGCNYKTTGIVPDYCCEKCSKPPLEAKPEHGRKCAHLLFTASLGKAAGPIAGPPQKKQRTAEPQGYTTPSGSPGSSSSHFQSNSYKWPPGKLHL